jgi:hypothetical protein
MKLLGFGKVILGVTGVEWAKGRKSDYKRIELRRSNETASRYIIYLCSESLFLKGFM